MVGRQLFQNSNCRRELSPKHQTGDVSEQACETPAPRDPSASLFLQVKLLLCAPAGQCLSKLPQARRCLPQTDVTLGL